MSHRKYKNNRNNKLLDSKAKLLPKKDVDELDAYFKFLDSLHPTDVSASIVNNNK